MNLRQCLSIRMGGIVLLLLCLPSLVQADLMLMVRTHQGFPEAMAKLQETIKRKGYIVSRVQRVDIGLTKSGYKTDKYRVVFFGKPDEFRKLTRQYPELVAYLPLKISIFAEGNDTILVTANPQHLHRGKAPQLKAIIDRWERDISSIFANMKQEE